MEIKINKEIREYTEGIFFGLSARQCFYAVLAILSAVSTYFILHEKLPFEIVSWICVLSAIPFALLGFLRYHSMTCGTLILAWLRYWRLSMNHLQLKPTNLYYSFLQKK